MGKNFKTITITIPTTIITMTIGCTSIDRHAIFPNCLISYFKKYQVRLPE